MALFCLRDFHQQELLVLVAQGLADLVPLVLRNLLAALLFNGAHFEVLSCCGFGYKKKEKSADV